MALWGRYNGKEYDLHAETDAHPSNQIAEGEVILFYVDPYYDDAVGKGMTDAKVDYFLKVKMKGAADFTGEPLTMPSNGSPITITPAIVAEYRTILLDRKLSNNMSFGEKKISASPVYLEIRLEQSATTQIFDKGALISISGTGAVDIYEDEARTQKIDIYKPLPKEMINNGKRLKIWLVGTKTGKITIEVKPDNPTGKFVAGKKAVVELSVIELMMDVYSQDFSELAKIKIDPDKDPLNTYYSELKNKILPLQVVMSDKDKVSPGRVLHLQNKNVSRAKLVCKKLEASMLPTGIDDYEIVINETNTSGSIELHTKEWDDSPKTLPLKIKLTDLKNNDQTFWVQGKSTTTKWSDVILDIGIDRASNTPQKAPKRNADWARFTIVEIKEVKVDYTTQPGKASQWDTTNNKFYINTKSDSDGRKITVGAKLSSPLKDVTIHFMLAPDKNNMKSANWGIDLPSTWKWKDIDESLKHTDKKDRKDLLHLAAKTDTTGYAKIKLNLSKFGGDIFTPAAYLDQDPHLASMFMVNLIWKRKSRYFQQHLLRSGVNSGIR